MIVVVIEARTVVRLSYIVVFELDTLVTSKGP